MFLDVLFIMGSLAGIILNFSSPTGTFGAIVVWVAILVYATLNLAENRLRASGKYD